MIDLASRGCAYYALDKILHQQGFTHSQLIVDNANKIYQLEHNKTDMYTWLTAAGVRMPFSRVWTEAKDIVTTKTFPFVVKQDTAVTLGIQTVIVKNKSDLSEVLKSILFTKCNSGLIQDYITGTELTVTLLVGASNYQVVGAARDYKKQFENDIGLNTSGMGSVNVLHLSDEVLAQCGSTVNAFRSRYGYRGFLSCQFIIDTAGVPWLMECNNRLCSPEFQSMAVNLPVNFGECLQCALTDNVIPSIVLTNLNSVTVGFLHKGWPTPQLTRDQINLTDSKFELALNLGQWDYNCYFGTLTCSGTESHAQLAKNIYNYLSSKDVTPYRYRTDIGMRP
jgi:phosphoribosylamine-glycine ligase